MACVRTYVALRIFSESFDVGAIGAVLDLAPTSIRVRNALSPRRFEREGALWKYSSKDQLESIDPQDHIDWLLSRLSGSEKKFDHLRDAGCVADVFCFLETGEQGGFTMTSLQMGTLSSLGLDLTWDIYRAEAQA
jgi:hypothetical protein